MKLYFVLLVFLITGCTHLKELEPGMIYVNETQVEGIELSLPIPFVENIYLLEFKFGFIQNKHCKSYKVNYFSDSFYKDINLLTGSGSVKRTIKVTNETDSR